MKNKFLSSLILTIVGLMSVCSCSKKSTEEEPKPKAHECFHLCPRCGKCTDPACTDPVCQVKCQGHQSVDPTPVVKEKHLITDMLGDYGGTANKSKYGEGSPLNGELDHEDSEYYEINDYYNMKSSDTRVILPNFQGYQQTMQDSDGLACALMIFNYEGLDVENAYSEARLVAIQESFTHKPVYKNGSSAAELAKVFDQAGYVANPTPEITSPSSHWIAEQIKNNKYVMVRYQDGVRYQWHLVIGVDEIAEDSTADDVMIFADPFDASDHYQDGYSVYHYTRFQHWWLHKLINGDNKEVQECVVIDAKQTFDLTKGETDPIVTTPHYPEKHRLLNANGNVGGSYGDGRYTGDKGSPGTPVSELNVAEHPDYCYYKTPDTFNLKDTETRKLCENYWTFKQTMSSSCGISSMTMCLNYYGLDWSRIGEFITEEERLGFVGYDPVTNPKFGGVDDNANDRKQESIVMVYCQYDTYFDTRTGKSFYNYGGVGSGNLSNVPTHLGFTKVEFGRYYRNNFNESKIPFKTLDAFETFAYSHLEKNEPVIFCWNPTGGHWETVICLDNMGTESTWDDVVILADSGGDYHDHWSDGYNTLPAHVMYGTWYNSSGSTNQQYVTLTRENNKGMIKA